MGKHFVYFYFMKNEPEKIKSAVGAHVEYWKKLALDNYRGGPFADRSGGLIYFEAGSADEAERIAMNDPFALENLLRDRWIKEWVVE